MKFQKLITPLLITVIICATLALGYQQDPLRLPNPFSGSRQTQEKSDQPVEVKELYLRITKLEDKVRQLEGRVEELQKPRFIPVNQK
jgi:TolA-binding protein